jgi:hypothetical protein
VLLLDEQGRLQAKDGDQDDNVTLLRFAADKWYDIAIRFDLAQEKFDVEIDGKPVLSGAEFLDPSLPLERISFRTGTFRTSPTMRDPKSPATICSPATIPCPRRPSTLMIFR